MIRSRILNAPIEDRIFAILVAVTAIVIAAQPVIGYSIYYVDFISNTLIFGIATISYNLLQGYTGLLSLGTAGFYIMGAYGGGLLMRYWGSNFGIGLLGALGMSGAFALFVGALATRVRGIYFLLVTFGFAMLPYLLIKGPLRAITGGHTGLHLGAPPAFIFDLNDPFLFFFFVWGLLIIVYIVLRLISTSPFGLSLKCIKENETKLSSLGYNTWLRKTLAVTISGTLTGFAGFLFLLKNLSISPVAGTYYISAKVVLCTIIGGLSTFVGPLVGTYFWYFIEEFLVAPGLLEIIMGVALVLVIARFPRGIIGEFLRAMKKLGAKN